MGALPVKEKTGAVYTAYLKDADETPIPLANITTITLTLYDVETGDIINLRNQQDVNNANNVTVHATSGLLTWAMQADDNPIISSSDVVYEHHRALFEFTYSGAGSPGKHEVDLHVKNLGKVT